MSEARDCCGINDWALNIAARGMKFRTLLCKSPFWGIISGGNMSKVKFPPEMFLISGVIFKTIPVVYTERISV